MATTSSAGTGGAATGELIAPAESRPSRTRRFWGEARRYPLIPIIVVMIMLVIPAIFAELIAPYDPLDGDLRVRLLPPAWIEGESDVKNVVAQMDPSKIGTEVMATNAARMVRNGGLSCRMAPPRPCRVHASR